MSELENTIKRLKENADNRELPYIIADIIKKNCSQNEINLILQNLKECSNINPSEALGALKSLGEVLGDLEIDKNTMLPKIVLSGNRAGNYKIVEQYILKAQKQEQKLDRVEKLTQLLFKERRKMGEKYIKWCKNNNAKYDDATTMITWVLCFKLKEVLNNE